MGKHCKTCGKNDHTRRSSSKWDHIIFHHNKNRFNQIRYKTETFTIKYGLNKFLKRNDQLISQINKDVVEIPALMIETSLLVNFYYYQLFESGFDLSGSEKPNFLNFFYQIL